MRLAGAASRAHSPQDTRAPWVSTGTHIMWHYSPGGYRVLELTAGLVVISITLTPDLTD
jgi:hypothetical protein